jgi:two-component system, chemotaxis family, chemotaxis protein CheY
MDTETAERIRRSPREPDSERKLREAPKSLVLIIDDDESIRTALAELLELSGYQVAVAADGQDALELLADGLEPNAIVLDLVMPRMDGWAFLSRLRADPRFQGVPVVVTSAIASQAPADADVYLQKPFDLGLLDHEVARLCAH